MEICVKCLLFLSFVLFQVFKYDLSHAVILPISQLQTSQVRSRTEYLIPTVSILVLLLHTKFDELSSLIDRFSIRFNG